MAVAAPEQLAERVAGRLEELWEEKPGLGSFLSTVDHKRIGKNYCYTAFLLFIAGGIEALFLRFGPPLGHPFIDLRPDPLLGRQRTGGPQAAQH